ncbi:hypothetical protein ACFFKU_06610 [Kineococcus gynurae]|uniref:Uncharacterized protein n=1 Tax=Kineococcus gynurae TaxID=452979 RepID=A0ABV5LX28_9ACTN
MSRARRPTTPGAITSAVTAAVAAAVEPDVTAFEAAVLELATMDAEQVHVVLGWALREQLERAHPDGLDADDLRDAVASAARAATWWPRLEPQLLVVVVTGALGAHDLAETMDAASPALTLGHALLLLTSLLPPPPDPGPTLRSALAEVRRAELTEMP